MSAWEDSVGESLDFDGIQHAEIYTGGNLVNELRRYDAFLRDYVSSDPHATLPLKITSGREISNTRIRNWANFKAPPMVLTFVCAGKVDTATRVREIFRAWIKASPEEYQAKSYGEILRIFMKAAGALRHLAGDRSGEFVYICEHFIEPAVIEDEARLAAGELEKDLDGVRLTLTKPAIEIVDDPNFYQMNVMLHCDSYPNAIVLSTRYHNWYKVNQDYLNKTPAAVGGSNEDLLDERSLMLLCELMITFAKEVGYGLRTHNRDMAVSGSTSTGMNVHDLAILLKRIPDEADYPLVFAANSLQAFNVCGFVLSSYLKWVDYQTGESNYQWTNNIQRDHNVTAQEYIKCQLENVLKDQRDNGLQLPESFFSSAWNQLRIEGGYVDSSLERKTVIEAWETEFQEMQKPEPLIVGDGKFPPSLSQHPQWAIDTGRVAAPWTNRRPEPEGIAPASSSSQDVPPEVDHGTKRPRTASSSSTPPPAPQPESEPRAPQWEVVGVPDTMVEYSFYFTKDDYQLCRSVLLTASHDIDVYPAAIDETPKFISNPTHGTAPVEHYVRRLVTYLGRVQSITQRSGGLRLQTYVSLETKEWLRMYARLYHACGLSSCRQIPHPTVLAPTALVNDESDLVTDESVSHEMRSGAMRMINSLRNHFSVGGRPDAITVRSQHTYLATDFVILHQSNTRRVTQLAESLRNKGWSEINFSAPDYATRCGMGGTEEAMRRMVTDIEGMSEDFRAQLTVHVHISLQGAVEDNMQYFLSEDGLGTTVRTQVQARLMSAIVNPIVDAAKLTARPPIVNINHDTRFIAKGKPDFAKKLEGFIGFHAMGSYVMLELRARGCIVIHGSSFWSKIACDLHQSHDAVYRLSNETHGEGDNHVRFRRAFAVYEKQLFSEKMVTACFLDPEQLNKWNDNVSVQTISTANLVEICEDRTQVAFTTPIDVGQWFSQESIARIQSSAQSDGFAEHATVTWQEFDIAMTTPEPYYDQRHYWFKIDDYSSNSNVSAPGKTYYCSTCENCQGLSQVQGDRLRNKW